jgi:hypothetical protein
MDENALSYRRPRTRRSRLWFAIFLSLALHLLLLLPVLLARPSQVTRAGPETVDDPVGSRLRCDAVFEDDSSGGANGFTGGQGGAAVSPFKSYPFDLTEPSVVLAGGPSHGETVAVGHIDSSSTGGAAGNGTGKGSGTRTTSSSWLSVPGEPGSIVYLIDSSLSMGQNAAFDTARRELLVSLRQLPPTCGVQVLLYDQEPRFLVPGSSKKFLSPVPAVLDEMAVLLEKERPGNDTNHCNALDAALALNPQTIVLVTDGDDLDEATARKILRANFAKTIIHTVELSSTRQRQPGQGGLELLAEQTHGLYRVVRLTSR